MGTRVLNQLHPLIWVLFILLTVSAFSANRDHGPRKDPSRGAVDCMLHLARVIGDSDNFNVLNYRLFKLTKRDRATYLHFSTKDYVPHLQTPTYLRKEISVGEKTKLSYRYYDRNEVDSWRLEIDKHLAFVFDTYLRGGVVPENEILAFKALERSLDPFRTEYFAFVEKGSQKTEAVIQIYYGGSTAGLLSDQHPLPAGKASWAIPIEREYPNLELEERAREGPNAHIINLARLAGSEVLTDVINSQFGRVAERLFELHAKPGSRPFDSNVQYPKNPVIYVEVPQRRAMGWVEKGFTISKKSSELEFLGGPAGRVLLKIPMLQKKLYDFHNQHNCGGEITLQASDEIMTCHDLCPCEALSDLHTERKLDQ